MIKNRILQRFIMVGGVKADPLWWRRVTQHWTLERQTELSSLETSYNYPQKEERQAKQRDRGFRNM